MSCLIGLLCGSALHAATQAGTIIKNQASASYLDGLGVRHIATSNVVETVIRQVAAFTLTRDQSKPGNAGQEVYFSHTLTNTGNGADRFTLAAGSMGSFSFTGVQLYADDNRDGQPDSYTPVTLSHLLAPNESQSVVVAGVIPAAALNGQAAQLIIKSVSLFDNTVVTSNLDTVTVTDSAVVSISKTISALTGGSPDGPFTVRIAYRNSSAADATDVVLIDALPQGMSYEAGTAVWSNTGSTALTDTDPVDDQSGIQYCAYDSSCVGLPEANADADSDSRNQVTAVITTVSAGVSGYVEFRVRTASGLASSVLYNTAEIEYTTSGVLSDRIDSNTVPFNVLSAAQVVLNGSTVVSTDGTGEPYDVVDSVFGASSGLPECQLAGSDPDGDGYGLENGSQCYVPDLQSGNSVLFKNTVWNTGNSVDTFNIATIASTFPQGTVIRILQSDGQTPLLDTNGDGLPDSGPMAPGVAYEITLHVELPVNVTGDNGGVPFEVTSVATSVFDSSISNPMRNRLFNITAAEVDITNVAELGSSAATGVGVGPEPSPVSSVSVLPGGVAVVELYINNTSTFPMVFDLSGSIHSDFSSIELPDQWQLQFVLSDGSVVSSTGVVAPGDFVLVKAEASVPASAVPASFSLYFKASSERYSVQDIKHDAITISGQESVLLGINQEGQTQPGGSHVYYHTLVNAGNTDVNNIALDVADSLSAEGWSSAVYEDTDADGALSAADQIINITSLAVGESKTFFVKVFAPGTAADGIFNNSMLTASWASESLSVTDTTYVSYGEIVVVKEQAPDVGCDGVLDGVYSSSVFSLEPGNNCVRYRLTASNNGSQSALNVVVADATPTFTSYHGGGVCSQPGCSLLEPAPGGQGDITASLPQLIPGDSVVVEFSVRVD